MHRSLEWSRSGPSLGLPALLWLYRSRGWFLLPVVAVAGAVWIHELAYVDPARMGDLGLAVLLPVPALLAMLTLLFAFCLAVHYFHDTRGLLVTILLTMLVLLFGLSAMVEREARFPVTWRFLGFADYVLRHHAIDGALDIYFNYPGFSIVLASLTGVSGASSLESVANWTPVLFNALYLAPLYVILSTLTADKRVVWLGLGLFLAGDWVGQDYLAPQAVAYFLYLLLLAILLRWLTVDGRGRTSSPSTPRQRAALLIVFLTVFAAIVVTHPLTPIFAIVAVTLLVVLRRARPRWLPIAMALMTAVWILLMARDFLVYHSYFVTGDLGQVGGNLNQNVTNRVIGSPGHLLIVRVRLMATAAIWGLAAIGLLRSWRRRAVDLRALVLMASPFPLFVFQSYGGELGLRVYLFTLPFAAFYAARMFYPAPGIGSGWSAATAGVVMAALVAGFLLSKYGNERQDYFTPDEVAAAKYLYSVAPPGSLLLSPNGSRPTRFANIEQHDIGYLDPKVIEKADVPSVEAQMRTVHGPPSYLIISRGEKAYADMSSGLAPGSVDRLQAKMEASPDFVTVYMNPDAEIFVLKTGRPGP